MQGDQTALRYSLISPVTVLRRWIRDHLVGVVQRRAERTALMRAMMVDVAFVLGQNLTQVPLTIDEQVIEALTA